MNLTEILAEYAKDLTFDDIPESVIEVQKQSLADALSCMAAATSLFPEAGAFTEYALSQCDTGSCTLLASKKKTIPALAALANGALIHALDYEDSHEKALVHPNSASTCAFLALIQASDRKISGKELLTALVLASDITCRLDLAVREDLLKYGWNMPPIHGSMGAVFGGGNLLGLTKEQIMDAVALDMSQAVSSGEASNSARSVVRTVRDGFAAQAAVQSLLLARTGISARFDKALEGKLGYYHAYARDNYDPEMLVKDLGRVFESEQISFKPWPSCRATHTAIEGLSKLIRDNHIRPEEIREIHLVMQEIGRMVFEPADVKYRPGSAAIAKFSMPFIIGALVTDGRIDLSTFEEKRFTDPAILNIADKVTFEIDESLTKAQNKYTRIAVKTTRGEYTATADKPLGCRENPLSEEDLLKKFENCFAASVKGYGAEHIRRIFDLVMNLEKCGDAAELPALL